MQPAIVLPIHDLDGVMFDHLDAITADLKHLFSTAFVSISPPTERSQASRIAKLQTDAFFHINFNAPGTLAGDHFMAGCRAAVTACPPQQMVHICGLDRVALALRTGFRTQFMADICAINRADYPVLFQRTSAAWASHPQNYRELEMMLTQVGELLFDQTLDFAWCHLAVPAQQLQEILPQFKNHDISVLAEFVLHLMDVIQTRDVDWLAWEDPFVYARDLAQMKHERETSLEETYKRLGYVIPKLQLLLDYSQKNHD